MWWRRLAVALVVLATVGLAAKRAEAWTKSFSKTRSNGLEVGNAPETFDGGIAFSDTLRWTIEDLTADDYGSWFTLDQTTAASYGFDLTALSIDWEARNGSESLYWSPFIKTTAGERLVGDNGIEPMTVFSPVGPHSLTIERFDFRVRIGQTGNLVADGIVYATTPEPAAAALLLLGVFGAIVHRQKTPYLARR